MMLYLGAAAGSPTSPLVGEVGIDARSAGIPGGGYMAGNVRAAVPPSLTLPRKGGGNGGAAAALAGIMVAEYVPNLVKRMVVCGWPHPSRRGLRPLLRMRLESRPCVVILRLVRRIPASGGTCGSMGAPERGCSRVPLQRTEFGNTRIRDKPGHGDGDVRIIGQALRMRATVEHPHAEEPHRSVACPRSGIKDVQIGQARFECGVSKHEDVRDPRKSLRPGARKRGPGGGGNRTEPAAPRVRP
jgi:hypothetical protein